MENNLLDWIEAEVSRYMRKYGCPNLYEKNDLISEGYIIAVDAIKKYDEAKKTSVKTYIQTCVKNRLIDLSRYETRRISEELNEVPSMDCFSYIDLCFTLEKISSPMLEDLVSGEIMSMNKLRRNGKEGKKCFAHIMQLYKSNEMIQVIA